MKPVQISLLLAVLVTPAEAGMRLEMFYPGQPNTPNVVILNVSALSGVSRGDQE